MERQNDFLADAAIALSDGTTELVIVTTIHFDLMCVDRPTALAHLDTVATTMSWPRHHVSVSGPGT